MALYDLLESSRSFRSFDSGVKVGREALLRYVAHARLCPSSINLQMLKFRLVEDDRECEKVLSLTKWAAKLKDITLPPVGHEPTAFIVICSDQNVIATADKFQKDVGICAQTIMLAAVEDGFGGCMIGSFPAEGLKQALALPAHLHPQLVLAIGKPDEAVIITDADEDGNVTYYRENGIHHVQKRALKDLIVE